MVDAGLAAEAVAALGAGLAGQSLRLAGLEGGEGPHIACLELLSWKIEGWMARIAGSLVIEVEGGHPDLFAGARHLGAIDDASPLVVAACDAGKGCKAERPRWPRGLAWTKCRAP